MKINAVTSYNFANLKSNSSKQAVNSYSPHFEGLFDSFKKQDHTDIELQANDEITSFANSLIYSDKKLKKYGKTYFNNLKKILKAGSKVNYKGMIAQQIPGRPRKNITFSDIDEYTKLPKYVNVWKNGELDTVYEIFSSEPNMTFNVTSYGMDTYEKRLDNIKNKMEYTFANDEYLGYYYQNDKGLVVEQYPFNGGFINMQGEQGKDNDVFLSIEFHYDYKNPENSYYRENREDGIREYLYNPKEKFWSYNRTIPLEEYSKESGFDL